LKFSAKNVEMNRDIRAIVTLLATQSMINLGEISDPITKEIHINLANAKLFIDLVEELEKKTRGNLSEDEKTFMRDVLQNLKKVYENKLKKGN
jgi:hypothetical protein